MMRLARRTQLDSSAIVPSIPFSRNSLQHPKCLPKYRPRKSPRARSRGLDSLAATAILMLVAYPASRSMS